MSVNDFRARLDDWWFVNWPGDDDALSVIQKMRLLEIITEAWFDGHRQGIKDMREGWEAHLKAKAGETA